MKKNILVFKKIKRRLWQSKPFLIFEKWRKKQSETGYGKIYMFHRCVPFETAKLLPNENLKVSPEFLDKFIADAKQNTDIISLDQLYELLKTGKKPKRPFSVFTFDDGYKDNLTYALPLFKKHKVPFAVYVSTCFPDYTANLWWYILEDLILANTKLIAGDMEWDCSTMDAKESSFYALRKMILAFPHENFTAAFSSFFRYSTFDLQSKIKSLALSWSEIAELSQSGFCTIAAHSVNHLNLKRLPKNIMIKETADSILRLEKHLKKTIEHFAYPYGSKKETGYREFSAIKKLNIKTAVLSYGGAVKELSLRKQSRLPRIMISELQK